MLVAYLMIVIDETLQEEESDTTRKEGHEKSTDGMKIGREGTRWSKKKVAFSGSD